MHLHRLPWLNTFLKYSYLRWIKMNANSPPWLEKFLKFTDLMWIKMNSNCPPWLEKNLKFTCLKWLKLHLYYRPWLEKLWNLYISNVRQFMQHVATLSSRWNIDRVVWESKIRIQSNGSNNLTYKLTHSLLKIVLSHHEWGSGEGREEGGSRELSICAFVLSICTVDCDETKPEWVCVS